MLQKSHSTSRSRSLCSGIFNGTEFNPNFYTDIEKAVDNEKGAVLVCSIGGILEPLGQGGRQSRYALPLIAQSFVHIVHRSYRACCCCCCCVSHLRYTQMHCCRSLMAAYELVSKGYKNVSILKGGFGEWERNGRYGSVQSKLFPPTINDI